MAFPGSRWVPRPPSCLRPLAGGYSSKLQLTPAPRRPHPPGAVAYRRAVTVTMPRTPSWNAKAPAGRAAAGGGSGRRQLRVGGQRAARGSNSSYGLGGATSDGHNRDGLPRVRRPVVELRRLRRRVPGDLLRVLEGPPVREVRRDPRRPERVAARRGREPRRRRPPLDHGQDHPPRQRPPRQPIPRPVHALKQRLPPVLEPRRLEVGVEGLGCPVVGRDVVPSSRPSRGA